MRQPTLALGLVLLGSSRTDSQRVFDCLGGYKNWQNGWSDEKKAWCCENQNRGCPGTEVPTSTRITTTSLVPTTTKRATPAPTTPSPTTPTTPAARTSDVIFVPASSTLPPIYIPSGPPDAFEEPPTPAPTPDCVFEFSSWETSWTTEKKDWCCKHNGHGCTTGTETATTVTTTSTATTTTTTTTTRTITSTMTTTFDCDKHHKAGTWTTRQQAMCCAQNCYYCEASTTTTKEVKTTTTEEYDCTDRAMALTADTSRDSWTLEHKRWCCHVKGVGCYAPPYNCSEAYDTRETSWSKLQQEWCCVREKRGCTTTTTKKLLAEYDCKAGLARWKTGWSAAKMAWCCKREGVACLTTTTSTTLTTTSSTKTQPYDCDEGYDNWEEEWAPVKCRWCCEHHKRGCATTTTVTVTTAPYDCLEDFATWQMDWSKLKQQWCCKNKGRACSATTTKPVPTQAKATATSTTTTSTVSTTTVSTTTTTEKSEASSTSWKRFDCDAGVEFWERGWSQLKKSWCCLHEGVACTPVTMPATQPATQPTTQPATTTSTSMKQTTPDHELGYCDEGYSNWESAWSDHKKDWCCLKVNRGCLFTTKVHTTERPRPTTSTVRTTDRPRSTAYDCSEGFSKWEQGWSVGKRVYCCLHEDKGCLTITNPDAPASPTPKPDNFECDVGVHNWRMGWSMGKKDWCCDEGQGGCGSLTNLEGGVDPYSQRGANRELLGSQQGAPQPVQSEPPALPQRQLLTASSPSAVLSEQTAPVSAKGVGQGAARPAQKGSSSDFASDLAKAAAICAAGLCLVAAAVVGFRKGAPSGPRSPPTRSEDGPEPLLGDDSEAAHLTASPAATWLSQAPEA